MSLAFGGSLKSAGYFRILSPYYSHSQSFSKFHAKKLGSQSFAPLVFVDAEKLILFLNLVPSLSPSPFFSLFPFFL